MDSTFTRLKSTILRTLLLAILLLPAIWVGYWLAVYWPSSEGLHSLSQMLTQEPESIEWRASIGDFRSPKYQVDRLRVLNLETGTLEQSEVANEIKSSKLGFSISIANPSSFSLSEANAFDLDAKKLRTWVVTHRDEAGRIDSFPLDLPGVPRVMFDSFAVTRSDEKLIAIDLLRPNDPPMEANLTTKEVMIGQLPKTKCILLYCDYTKGNMSRYAEVYDLTSDGLRQVAKWDRFVRQGTIRGENYVVFQKPDGTQVIHDIKSDCNVPIEIEPSVDLSKVPWEVDWNNNAIRVNSQAYYDFGTWKQLPAPEKSRNCVLKIRDEEKQLLVYLSKDSREVKCISEATGKELWTRNAMLPSQEYIGGLFLLKNDRVSVLGNYLAPEVTILDITNGQTLRIYQPLGWMSGAALGMLLYVLVLVGGWIIASIRQNGWAWWDCSLLLLLGLLAMAFRMMLAGDVFAESRWEMRVAQAIAAVGSALTTLWLVFGRTRWTLKILLPTIWTAVVCAVVSMLYGMRSWQLGSCLLGLGLLWMWMFAVAWLVAKRGLILRRMSTGSIMADTPVADTGAGRFPLRDIFMITTAVAVLLVVLRSAVIPQSNMFTWGFLEQNVYDLLVAIHAMVAAWCAMGTRSVWVRLVVGLLAVFLLPALGVLLQAWIYKSPQIVWMVSFHYTVHCVLAVGVVVLLQTYRWRGWRFDVFEPMNRR